MYYPDVGGKILVSSSNPNPVKAQIAHKAARGIVWNFLTYGLSKAVTLLTLSILAHLLTKSDFGLVAIAMVAINYLAVFKDLGLGAALIQRRGNIEEAADTVFTINLVIGLFLTTLIYPAAPFVANYFHDPQVTPVLRWLGVSFLINAIGSIHMVRLRREMDFRLKLIPDLGNSVVKGVVSVSMAISGFGIWSLVTGQLVGAVASTLLAWRVLPWRPRIHIKRSLAGSLMKYGTSVMGSDSIGVVVENLAAIIVGRFLGMAVLGIYSLAYRLPEMLIISILWVIGDVLFPAFSAIQNRSQDMVRGFLTTIRLMEIIVTPVCLGMIITADPIIRVLFGDQWLDAIPILRILAAYAWVYTIGFHVGAVYKAVGRPEILLKLSILTLIISFPALLIGARYGLTGVALSQLCIMIIRRTVGLTASIWFIDVKVSDILRQLKPSLQCGLIMSVITIPVYLFTLDTSPLIQLLVVSAIGASVYVGTLWIFQKDALLQIISLSGLSHHREVV